MSPCTERTARASALSTRRKARSIGSAERARRWRGRSRVGCGAGWQRCSGAGREHHQDHVVVIGQHLDVGDVEHARRAAVKGCTPAKATRRPSALPFQLKVNCNSGQSPHHCGGPGASPRLHRGGGRMRSLQPVRDRVTSLRSLAPEAWLRTSRLPPGVRGTDFTHRGRVWNCGCARLRLRGGGLRLGAFGAQCACV